MVLTPPISESSASLALCCAALAATSCADTVSYWTCLSCAWNCVLASSAASVSMSARRFLF